MKNWVRLSIGSWGKPKAERKPGMMLTLYNAKVHTLDPGFPAATAIAVEGGKILAVGDDESILNLRSGGAPGSKAEVAVYDAGGRTIIPGLIDAHIHLEHFAFGLQKVDCETATRAECLSRVAGRAAAILPGEWIQGHGWNQNNWPEGFGSRLDLDSVAPGRPVYLTAKSLHAGWVNSAALRQAGIDDQTPDPPGGKIQRDEAGQPTGILFESAMQLVFSAIPEPTIEATSQAIRSALRVLWGMGLTGVHDFDGRRCFAALQLLRERGELAFRVVKNIPLVDLPHAAGLGLRSGFGDDTLRIGSVKAFADGALGPQTAAMFQPYEGGVKRRIEDGGPAPEQNRGMLLLDAEELFEHGRLAVDNGLSLAVHAIGDLANHEVLNAYAQLREYEKGLSPSKAAPTSAKRLRHRIEHVQLIHPGDAHRLAELGVIASMQPLHAPSDMLMADRYWGERAAFSYAWRTQIEYGAALAFGSDAPVESPNPFWGIHAAVTRRRADGSPGPEGWYPAQKLTLLEAIKAYTTGAAYAAGMEERLGRLAPGCLADLLVLEEDPFFCEPERLREIRPAATMVGGEWVLFSLNSL
jgi:predicted amidohydrolase YtcJ